MADYLGIVLDEVAKRGGHGINIYGETALIQTAHESISKGYIKSVEVEGFWNNLRQGLGNKLPFEWGLPVFELTESGRKEYERIQNANEIPEYHLRWVMTG